MLLASVQILAVQDDTKLAKHSDNRRMRRGVKGVQLPPGFGQILEEIRANSEKIRTKQKKKKSVKKHKNTRAHNATYARTDSHPEY